MNSIRNIARLNEVELANCTPPNGSWHTDYRDTAYIHIGGLPFDLSEGDVLLIFSQYGNPVHITLARDKETGKSRGFGWLKYEDQRSADLAVDNLSGAVVLGRTLSVDHARYNLKEGERETVGDSEDEDADMRSRKRRKSDESESEEEEERRPLLKEEIELAKLLREHDDDDPMKKYMIEQKKAEVEEALKAVAIPAPKKKDGEGRERRHKHRHHHRSRRERSDEEDNNDRKPMTHRPRREVTSEDDRRDAKRRSQGRERRDRTATPEDEEAVRRKRRPRYDESDSDVDRYKARQESDRKRRHLDSEEERPRSREPYRKR